MLILLVHNFNKYDDWKPNEIKICLAKQTLHKPITHSRPRKSIGLILLRSEWGLKFLEDANLLKVECRGSRCLQLLSFYRSFEFFSISPKVDTDSWEGP